MKLFLCLDNLIHFIGWKNFHEFVVICLLNFLQLNLVLVMLAYCSFTGPAVIGVNFSILLVTLKPISLFGPHLFVKWKKLGTFLWSQPYIINDIFLQLVFKLRGIEIAVGPLRPCCQVKQKESDD